MLTRLDRSHGAALADFFADYHQAGEARNAAYFCGPDPRIEQVVATLDGWSRGEGLTDIQVPHTTWFWVEGDALLGVIDLRHHLDDRLRQLGGHIGYTVRPSARRRGLATRMLGALLPVARERGLDRVLLTCAPDNVGSIRVIEAHGGVLQDEGYDLIAQRGVRRYWIGERLDRPG